MVTVWENEEKTNRRVWNIENCSGKLYRWYWPEDFTSQVSVYTVIMFLPIGQGNLIVLPLAQEVKSILKIVWLILSLEVSGQTLSIQ